MANDVDWTKELSNLVGTAKTDEEKQALQAFEGAIKPYLEKPDMLRTLLSKIASSTGGTDLGVIVNKKHFDSIDQLNGMLPNDVNLVKL